MATLLSQFTGYLTTALAGRFGDGTVAAPGITFAADQDTGVRRTGDNALAIVTGGVDRITVSSSGAVATAGPFSVGKGTYPVTISSDSASYANMGVGYGAGNTAAATGSNNVAVGLQALSSLTSGGSNSALGLRAGQSVNSGSSSVYVGTNAGSSVTTGGGNTLLGYGAGSQLAGSDGNNTIVGIYAAVAGMNGNIVLADGSGTPRYRWDGATNTIAGNLAVTGNQTTAGTVSASTHNVYTANAAAAALYGVATQDDIAGPGWAIGCAGIANLGTSNPTSTTGRTWGLYGAAPGAGAGGAVNVGVMAWSKSGYQFAAFNYAQNGYSFFVDGAGNIQPGTTDNTASIGTASNRYSTVFAGTNTINTSDKTLKTVRSTTLTNQERAWAKSIAVVAYQFNDAIAEKGVGGARMHWGVLAQDVYQAGLDAGIADPMHYAFLCRDPLTVHRQEIETVPTRVPAMETVQEPQTTIEMIDGRAVQRVVIVPVERQIVDSFPVFDESGNPLTRIEQPFVAGSPAAAEVRDDAGEVVQAAVAAVPEIPEVRVPIVHDVPRLIDSTAEVARDITEPVLDDHGAPVMRWGIRYTELLMFLLACQPPQS
ncbi:tail fiber domain-containing protein [Sphingomonas sp. CROZ-RG-20F-R02-07]|uniref:tail fiber domain-containing protein n=1 Tax=Sphingomonas sp. CROZ-RG-20F-R02-07 TaxID=2914832 RepID=UPI001F585D00|nr:tail fiber domain-containing protein [Sphingomonas sp. CROZ-RG-20F-R02-07]